jgi:hypothetical protein
VDKYETSSIWERKQQITIQVEVEQIEFDEYLLLLGYE